MKNLIRSLYLLVPVLFAVETRAQVPVMSSYPTASAVIFLDFDGHTVDGTSWNYMTPILCGPSGLTNTKIIEIFNRVAEDYRPFNLNITTDSTKFLAAPLGKRMRVLITTSHSWYSSSYGGVAFNDSFTWGDDSPCFVFSALQGYNTKIIAEGVSHEAGHTLGLNHQASYNASCARTSEYHMGLGSGEIGWAPIMGVGYYKNFTLWNNGPTPYGCTNYQNDLEIITSPRNGFSYRMDDHSNSFATATLSIFNNKQFNASGVIEKNTDQDVFSFIVPYEARFQLDAVPYNVGTGNAGSDLDMQVTVYNESMSVLNVYNPGALLSSVVDTTLDAGTYYVRIEGKGNLYAPAYASLGSYSLLARFDGGGTPLPIHRFELRGAQNGDLHQLSWLIDADEKIVQQLLEVSTDGRNFISLTEPRNEERSYFYRPAAKGTKQYRLNVVFDNGQRYYSNVLSIRETEIQARPYLVSNLITSQTIQVSSPGNYSYTIIDLSGRIISSGKLINGNNNINASGMIRGMYVIRFAGNEQQWTEKLMKQ
jgi:hypothetical protein